MNSVFISFVLKGMLASLIQLQAGFPADIPAPVDPVTIQGYKSDVKMIYRQDMLGLGESAAEDVNPYLAIKPNDPRGVVIPTSTAKAVADVRIVPVYGEESKQCTITRYTDGQEDIKCE